MDDVDLMTGAEFEKFIGKLFIKMGYNVQYTKATGDQGVDLIIQKGIQGQKIGVQTKCYSNKVSNGAIQEVVAGCSYHKCDKGMVITNSSYTKSAMQLAEANNIVLWDRKILIEKVLSI